MVGMYRTRLVYLHQTYDLFFIFNNIIDKNNRFENLLFTLTPISLSSCIFDSNSLKYRIIYSVKYIIKAGIQFCLIASVNYLAHQ